jgi:cell division septum initiation protein DivIVA
MDIKIDEIIKLQEENEKLKLEIKGLKNRISYYETSTILDFKKIEKLKDDIYHLKKYNRIKHI